MPEPKKSKAKSHLGAWYRTPSDTEMEERAAKALRRTWAAIAPDVLENAAGLMRRRAKRGTSAESVTLSRDEVIDAVTGCGYANGHPESHGQDEEAIRWLDGQPDAVKERVLRAAFPDTGYGA